MSTKATWDDSRAELERMTESVVALCEIGVRGTWSWLPGTLGYSLNIFFGIMKLNKKNWISL